jgi:serine/threonine-protein kinase
MGSVWRAHDLNLGADVAIKLIDSAIAESVEAVNRFRQEAQSAATIRSTHVVQILDHGVDDGRPFIAMELLEGEDLGQRLHRVGQLDPAHVASVLGQVGRALSLAHAHGIIHRDLKPDNIFLVREGDDEIAKVLDFGVARKVTGLTDASTSKTRTGAMLGTPYYMSPEQATGQTVDPSSDIWAFGVIAFECLTGRRAFDGESVGALFHAICMLEPPVPSSVASVPDGFDVWFARAVCRDKSKRFATIKAAATELRALCGRHSGFGSASDLLGYRSELASQQALTTTAVSAISSSLERTGAPSTRTLIGQVRKRPMLAGVLSVALVTVALLAISTVRTRSRHEQGPRSAASAVSAMPSKAADVSQAGAPVSASLPVDVASTEPIATAAPLASASAPLASARVVPRAPASGNAEPKGLVVPVKKTSAKSTDLPKSKEKKSFFKRDDNAAGI